MVPRPTELGGWGGAVLLGWHPSLMPFLKGPSWGTLLLPKLFTPWESPAPFPRLCAAFVASFLIQVLLFSPVKSFLWGKERAPSLGVCL